MATNESEALAIVIKKTMQHPAYLAEASVKTNIDSNTHGIACAYWIMASGKGRNRQSARVHPFYFILQTTFLLSLMTNMEGASSRQAAAASILSRYYSSQGTSSRKSRESILKDGRFGQLVRKLCAWRDFVAWAEDESLCFILSDRAIMFLAKTIPTSPKRIYGIISAVDSVVIYI